MKRSDRALEFWNCKCTRLFVHRDTITYCPKCEADSVSSPSSKVAEVVDQYGILESEIKRRSN
jgi:hypothetical protein